MSAMLLTATLLATTNAGLEVKAPPSCFDQTQVNAALQGQGVVLGPDMNLRVTLSASGTRSHRMLLVTLHDKHGLLLHRSVDSRPGDCPSLPRWIALVVQRRLLSLPQESRARRRVAHAAEPSSLCPRQDLVPPKNLSDQLA